MSRKKRHRIHPAVAVAAIAGIVVLTLSAQQHGINASLKMLAIAIIAYIAGVKTRKWLPVT